MRERSDYPAGGRAFDLGAAIVLGLFIIGAYIDGWAHNHYGNGIESFFTVWHAALYGGFFLSALYVVIPAIRNRRTGYDWAHCLPKGYRTMLAGVVIFAIFGFIDMIWHIFLGFENSVDAFMSPPHIGLFLGSLLMFSGPIAAALARNDPDRTSWKANAAYVLALVWFFAELTFVLQPWLIVSSTDASRAFAPAGPYWSSSVRDLGQRVGTGEADIGGLHADAAAVETTNRVEQLTSFERLLERTGTGMIVISATLIAALLLFAIKAGRIPVGTFTLIFFLDTLGMSLMKDVHLAPGFPIAQIVTGLLWGIVADVLYAICKPAIAPSRALYTFMFLAPACMFAIYFIAVALNGGIWWTVALAPGSAIYAGGIGVLLALVAARYEPA